MATVATLVAGRIAETKPGDRAHQQRMLGLFALTAVALITAGLLIEVPLRDLPVAMAALLIAVAFMDARVDIDALRPAAYALTALFVLLTLPAIRRAFGLCCAHDCRHAAAERDPTSADPHGAAVLSGRTGSVAGDRVVPREHLANALSLIILAWQIATVIGPAIAGNLIAWFAVTIVYSVDAVSFLAMIAALFTISAEVRVDPASRPGSGAIREGLQFVFSTPIIRSTMLLDFFATLFGCANTLMPMFATQVLGVGARGLGLLYAAPPAGAAIAGAIMSFMPAVRRQGKTVLWSIAVYGLATVAFGLSTWLPLSMVWNG